MFNLSPADLEAGILDCGGGPASFVAEVAADGVRAAAVDPVYAFAAHEIRSRFEATVEPMLAQVRATPGDWTWSFHRDPEDLVANRRRALERFLSDYEAGRAAGRYLIGELPELPFGHGEFGLALCSHLLFLYSDLLSEEFHIRATLELTRVAREVRIFPLLTLQRQPSAHLDPVRAALRAKGWQTKVVQVPYELQRGGNEMLRVFRETDGSLPARGNPGFNPARDAPRLNG